MPIDGRGLLGIKVGDLGLKAIVSSLPHQRSGQGRFPDASLLRHESDDGGQAVLRSWRLDSCHHYYVSYLTATYFLSIC